MCRITIVQYCVIALPYLRAIEDVVLPILTENSSGLNGLWVQQEGVNDKIATWKLQLDTILMSTRKGVS